MRTRFRSSILIVLLLSGCASWRGNPQLRFRRQEDIGTIHVAVQSVARFEDYIAVLQPQFSLTSDKALEAAILQTQVEDSQLYRAIVASLSAQFPASAAAAAGTPAATTGTSSPATPAPTSTPAQQLSLPTASSVNIDSSLRYRAATALLQQVAILNSYVKDAAIRTDSQPYVVRLLLTLSPSARALPYDAYSVISFFNNGKSDGCRHKFATVVPLLATDNFEASLHQDTTQRMQDLAATLKASMQNVGAEASARGQATDANKTMVNNLNSLFSIARLSENAVEARLGAAFANGSYAMTARTYDVALLVNVPSDSPGSPCKELQFTAYTYMRDAERGTMMPSRNEAVLATELPVIAANYHWNYAASADVMNLLVRDAEAGDFESFRRRLKDFSEETHATAAWNDFLAVAGRLGRSTGTFELPEVDAEFFSDATKTTLFDDGEQTRLDLTGASRLVQDLMNGTLRVDPKSGTPIYVNDSAVRVSNDRRRVTIEFPSIRKLLHGSDPAAVWLSVRFDPGFRSWEKSKRNPYFWYPVRTGERPESMVEMKYDDMVKIPCKDRLRMNLNNYPDELGCRPFEEPVPYSYIGKLDEKAAAPGFTIALPAFALVKDGVADLAIEFRCDDSQKKLGDIHFVVDGAYVDSSVPAIDRKSAADFVVQADSAYVLKLKNVHYAKPVRVKAFRVENGKKIYAPDALVELR